jgi:hypothetical protein
VGKRALILNGSGWVVKYTQVWHNYLPYQLKALAGVTFRFQAGHALNELVDPRRQILDHLTSL